MRWRYPALLFVVAVVTRIPFTSKLLYDQDAVQFALALEKYDVYLQQPHPPGYFLYVMAGKLINVFLHDANVSFLILSVIGSGLTVVAVYYLATMIFDREAGLWAATLAVTSPLLWYFGELALTYVVAAFFNVWIAILSWKILQRDLRWVYLSPMVLGIAAGIRQDLAMFLFPLWLFSVMALKPKQVLTVGIILCVTVAAWFIPMLVMTGGTERYLLAVRELWHFHNRTFSIWNAGIASRGHFFLAFFGNTSYGIGIGMIFLLLGLYALLRTGEWRRSRGKEILFFVLWLLPAFSFHMLVFMNPDHAGYSVFFLPALFVILWPSVKYVLSEMGKALDRYHLANTAICRATAVIIIVLNAMFFLLSDSVVSAKGIREHDNHLASILQGIEKNFPPEATIIIDDRSYQLYNYRHIQYYLRRYRVYLTALDSSESEPWHILLGRNGQTFIVEKIEIPSEVRYVVHLANPLDRSNSDKLEAQNLNRLPLDQRNSLFYEIR